MKLALLKAFLAIQVCQVVQATEDHADNLTSRVSKTLTKQFKTISSVMKKNPVNVKSIHALQKKKKNFKSLHRGLEQDFEVSDCLMDLYNIFEISDFYELDVYLNGFTILPDFSAYTWIGSDLSELTDACADLGGSISFLDMNVEGDQCEEVPLVYGPFCIPNSCTIEEALEVLNQGPPDDDYFGDDDNIGDVDGDDVRRLDEDNGTDDSEGDDHTGTDDSEGDDHTDHDDFFDDCSYEYVLSEGPPEITDSCFTYVYNIVAAKPDLFLVRYLYGFFTEFDNLEYYFDLFGFGFGGDVDKILTNFTDTCEGMDASVYFTKGETNGKCFSEDSYGYQLEEAEGWDVLPECIPNKCTQEEALEAYKTLYSMQFESQPECVFELEYTFPPDDETPEESPPSPPSPDGPSKAPKSMKSAKSTKNSKAPKMVKMPKMPKTVKIPKMVKMSKMAKAAKDEYKGLRSSFLH